MKKEMGRRDIKVKKKIWKKKIKEKMIREREVDWKKKRKERWDRKRNEREGELKEEGGSKN